MNGTYGNPVIQSKGVADPHIRVFSDRAYLYASHDADPEAERYTMPDWWIWSSDDLAEWTLECVIRPEDTFIGTPFKKCFAITQDKPFLHKRDGIYYWSMGCYYAMSESLYGPYTCQGSIILEENIPPSHHFKQARGITEDRHGSFFEWRGQWYFACKGHSFFNQFKDKEGYAMTLADMDRFLVSLGYLEGEPAPGESAAGGGTNE